MSRSRTRGRAPGFTLVDLLTTLAILAIALAVAIPSTTPDARARLRGGASLIASDIEYAQTLSLASPSDPALVRFAADGLSYWIARSSAPDTPVNYPGGEDAYIVTMGQGRAALLFDCAIATDGLTDRTLAFDEFARPTTLEPITITLSGPTDAIGLVVSTSTGAISFASP